MGITKKRGLYSRIAESRWGKYVIAIIILNEIRGMMVAGPGFGAIWLWARANGYI